MFQYVIDISIFVFILLLLGYIYVLAWRFWIMAIQTESQAKLKWIMLEVRLPRIVDKSPKAFEIAAGAFLQAGGIANRFALYWKGNMPIYHTLEIVSLEGEIHFYIRIQDKFKTLVMNNMYSQYPTLEIVEVPDYMDRFKMTHHTSQDQFAIWGINYSLGKDITVGSKDKEKTKSSKVFKVISYLFYGVFIDVYDGISNMFSDDHGHHAEESSDKDDVKIKGHHLMINTYVDYEMDKDPKEIFKHDPLTPVLEWLGSLGKGNYGIYQICISDEGNFKGSSHSIGGASGGDKWPALYTNPLTDNDERKKKKLKNDQLKFADIANFRKNQIRTSPETIKHKKGDVVYDNYGNKVTKKVDSGEKDADGKPMMKEVDVTYGQDQKAGGENRKEMELTAEEKLEIEIINRKLSKPTFLATVRSAWIKENDIKNSEGIQSTLSLLKQFGRQELGYGFAPGPATGGQYDYGWENTFKKKVPWRDEEFFEALVERECFFSHANFDAHKDTQWDLLFWDKTLGQKKMWRMIYDSIFHPFTHVHADNVMVLNTEELATLYHFPGEVAATPGLKRIDSVKSDAPNNLPV